MLTAKNEPFSWRSRLSTLAGSVVLLIVVGLVILAIAWARYRQIQAAMSAPPPPEMPISVELIRPQPAKFRRNTVVVGSALAHRSIVVRNEVTGVVTEVAMTPGGWVKAGDLLIQIDDRVEQAQLKSAKATLKLAQASLERARKLQTANANSIQELDIALADADRAEAEVDRLKILIDHKRITAEFDAKVGLFDLHVGQYLDVATDIATLEGVADYLHVDFSVPAHVADSIQVGDTASMRAGAGLPPLPARIIAMDSRADPQSRSLTVRARIDSPPQTLLPGDSVLVTVRFGPALDAVLVPQTAVRRGPSGTTVFVAIENEADDGSESSLRAKSVSVELAGSDGTMSRIVDGLTLDERIVASGSFKVFDGSLLMPVDAPVDQSTPSAIPASVPPEAVGSRERETLEQTSTIGLASGLNSSPSEDVQ